MLSLHPDVRRTQRRAYDSPEVTAAWVAAVQRRLAGAGHAGEGEPTPRLHVTAAELVAALNAELAANPRCAGLSVRAGERLRPVPGATGCNWPPSALVVDVQGFVGPDAFEALNRVVAEATRRFRLDDPR